MKKYKVKNGGILILGIGLLLTACSQNKYFDNQTMIKNIDSLVFSEIITKVEVDSMENIVDTVSIVKKKYDDDEIMRCSENTFFFENDTMTVINYLKPDSDLFYRKTINGVGEVVLTYETKSIIDGHVESAIQIAKEGEEVDTTTMAYEYQYHPNGNKKMIIVNTSSQQVGEMYLKATFNLAEQRIAQVMVAGEDTISAQFWEYENDMLSKVTLFNYLKGRVDGKTANDYAGEERLMGYTAFQLEDGNFVKTIEAKQEYDEAGDLIELREHNLSTNKVRVYKYFNETL